MIVLQKVFPALSLATNHGAFCLSICTLLVPGQDSASLDLACCFFTPHHSCIAFLYEDSLDGGGQLTEPWGNTSFLLRTSRICLSSWFSTWDILFLIFRDRPLMIFLHVLSSLLLWLLIFPLPCVVVIAGLCCWLGCEDHACVFPGLSRSNAWRSTLSMVASARDWTEASCLQGQHTFYH